jgi:hypothetical protein
MTVDDQVNDFIIEDTGGQKHWLWHYQGIGANGT